MKRIQLFFLNVFFFPFLIAYKLSDKRATIDVDLAIITQKSRPSMDKYSKRGILLVYTLLHNKYYRNIFYKRIPRCHRYLRIILPQEKTFYPCDKIGAGVYPAHPFATVLNAQSIGDFFSFRHCTTLGNKRDGDHGLGPIIGDNVTLGANVCIIGDITIGNNVIVGAGSVVVKDVPSNCIVAGNPAKVIKQLPANTPLYEE